MILFVIFFTLSIMFILISKSMQRRVRKMKNNHGIVKGEIIYTDLNKPAKSFFSKKYRITGKPDYIVVKDEKCLPVELKTGGYTKPQWNHILQLAAYCQLLEENYGGFVPYGILVYNNQFQYKIPFNPRVRFELENTINEMRHLIKTGEIYVNHDDPGRCKNCSMREYCNVSIS
ncbi:MAG: CRISPR-associated protein Cas4 [Thermoplasmata archaeon]|nr:MAG: CRISPR-associated protein Cas4 [Thermoplasmata archaeon]